MSQYGGLLGDLQGRFDKRVGKATDKINGLLGMFG